MSDSPESKSNAPPVGNGPATYDPSLFLSSLYGMNAAAAAAFGRPSHPLASALAGLASQPNPEATTTLGVAASQAASLGANAAWYAMAQQLAAQDYMARLSAANPSYAAAALVAAQRSASPTTPRLPSDTELIKQQSSSTPKSTGGRGRKKTISLDPSPSANAMFLSALTSAGGGSSNNNSSSSSPSRPATIPSGLTIERKKARGGSSSSNSCAPPPPPPIVDRVEITKVPLNNGIKSSSSSSSNDEAPLNLSLKTAASTAYHHPLGSSNKSSPSNKIPTDYYASQALSGAFLAEQIRQSQLAAALESRLESSSSSSNSNQQQQRGIHQQPLSSPSASVANLQNIQAAALLMNKLKASHQLTATTTNTAPKRSKGGKKGSSGGGGGSGLTVASLLSKHRNGVSGSSSSSTQEEVEKAEKTVAANPELTIEPIFKEQQPTTPPPTRRREDKTDGSGWKNSGSRDSSSFKEENCSVEDDGKLKIKNISESPEIRNLSDQEESDEEEDEGSENGGVGEIQAPGPKSGGPSDEGRLSELQLPISNGWKREALVREYSKSGFRGDIFYYAPCGKKFKQYSEILRYLEKKGIKDLQREHFSFSTKILIGEFLKPTGQAENGGQEKYLRLNEREMIEDLEAVRKENGWEPKKRSSLKGERTSNGKEDKTQQILLETLQQNQSSDALMHRDAMKLLKEAERAENKKKQEEAAAAARQRALEAANAKIQERELKRQQAILLKEQERERRRQHMIFMKLMEGKRRSDDRERRREDLRIEKEKDRERRIEQRRLEYEIITELKKPCEDMMLTEEAKPIPDFERMDGMLLSGEAFANILMVHEFVHNFGDTLGFDVDALPSLSSLQSSILNDTEYEEELLSIVIHLVVCAIEDPGIPTPNKHLTLMGQNLRQADITNTNISEILKIYLFARGQAEVRACHGFIPPPEFFHHNSHGGPVHHISHYHYYKDRKLREEGPNLTEYTDLLMATKPFKMSQWVKDKPFLCLNPLEKSEVVSYLCNELLGNKAVMAQVDNNLENIVTAKKRRWTVENKLKKLRMLQQRKFKPSPCSPLPSSTNSSEAPLGDNSEVVGATSDKDEDENDASLVGINAEESKESTPVLAPKRKGRPPGSKKRKMNSGKATVNAKKRRSKDQSNPPGDEDGGDDKAVTPSPTASTTLNKDAEGDHASENNGDRNNSDDEDEDEFDDEIKEEEEKMSQEELQKRVDKTLKLLNKRRDELIQSTNRFRAADLGQDRYRRRYWHLAYTDGVFVEGMESSEPWKLESRGMPSEEKRLKLEKMEMKSEDNEEITDEECMELDKVEVKVVKAEEKEEDNKEDVQMKETNGPAAEEKTGTPLLLKEDPPEAAVSAIKSEEEEEDRSMLKITPNGDKLNLFNHSAQFNMSLSPVILNGSVTITPKQTGGDSLAIQGGGSGSSISKDAPWFSILPMGNPISENPSIPVTLENKFTPHSSSFMLPMGGSSGGYNNSVSSHIEMLENKLASIRQNDEKKTRMPIPKELSRGWWRISSSELLRNVEYALHPRGCREHSLLWNLKKCVEALVHHHFDGSKNPSSIGEELEFELSETLKDAAKDLLDEHGAVLPDKPGEWSTEVAVRVEKYILEQVEALEDKVAAASMQVPGWKLPNRLEDIEDRKFRPSCIPLPEGEEEPTLPDAITEAKERLLDLEKHIERRYLKAPLGFGNNEPTLQTITSARTTLNSSKTPLEDPSPLPELSNGKGGGNAPPTKEEEENGMDNDETGQKKEGEGEEDEEEAAPEKEEVLPRGLQTWREGVQRAKNAAQLAMGFYVLETSIAWHKSIMKAFCQLCHSGDNEDSLLLCDGCDKGYHMYCFKPSLTNVPDGDWYCFECINKATGIKHCLVCGKQEGRHLIHCSQCPRAYHTDCLSPALSKSPRGKWQCPACQARAPSSSRKKNSKKTKFSECPAITDNEDSKDVVSMESLNSSPANTTNNNAAQQHSASSSADAKSFTSGDSTNCRSDNPRSEESGAASTPNSNSKPGGGKKKKYSKIDRDLTACSTLLSELENSEEAWPFLYPVNTKQFPTYRKVIKNPMDIATIKRRLDSGIYKVREDFCCDVRQIFANCEIFNEDDSPVGKAGHAMRTFFETRWAELTSN